MKNKLPQWSKSIQKSEVKVPDMSFHLPLYWTKLKEGKKMAPQ